MLCKVAARRRGKGTSHLSGLCCLWFCEALEVKLGRYRGSPSASCGPAHRGEGSPPQCGRRKKKGFSLSYILAALISPRSPVFLLLSLPTVEGPQGSSLSLHLQCSSSCDLNHSHRLSSCFSPAPSPVSGALTSLWSLASAYLMKLLHPGGVNSFPSPGKQPPLDHTAAHPRRPH